MEQNDELIKIICYCAVFAVYTLVLYVINRRRGAGIKEVFKQELLYAITTGVSFSTASLMEKILTSTYATEHKSFEILIKYKEIMIFLVSFIASVITVMIVLIKFKNFFIFLQEKKLNDQDSLKDEEKIPLSV